MRYYKPISIENGGAINMVHFLEVKFSFKLFDKKVYDIFSQGLKSFSTMRHYCPTLIYRLKVVFMVRKLTNFYVTLTLLNFLL